MTFYEDELHKVAVWANSNTAQREASNQQQLPCSIETLISCLEEVDGENQDAKTIFKWVKTLSLSDPKSRAIRERFRCL
jgi:hypothetical protein